MCVLDCVAMCVLSPRLGRQVQRALSSATGPPGKAVMVVVALTGYIITLAAWAYAKQYMGLAQSGGTAKR